MQSPSRPGHLPWFDWLRLFLALEVVWLHIPLAHRGNPTLVLPIAPVPAFVAISGYLIAGSLKTKRNLGEFWRNRALRILPGFFLALGVTWLCFGDRALIDSLRSYVQMQPIITGPGSDFALWSLSVEEVLYALLALALIFKWIDRPAFARMAFWISFCVLAVYAVTVMVNHRLGDQYTHPHGGLATGLSIPMFFFAGVFMNDSEYLPWVQRNAWWFLVVAVAGAVGYTLFDPAVRGVVFIFMSVGSAFGVVGLGSTPSRIPRLTFDLSYGVYILHLPMLGLIDRYASLTGVPYLVACMSLPLVAAGFSWFLVEKPCLDLKKRLGTPRQAQA
jgi:peptidoglycan/LPS O-acetylase OafA/YrhL